jgi:cell division protein FtsL
VKYLYKENYKTLKKDIKEDIRKWKALPFLWIGKISIMEKVILLKTIYRVNVMAIKFLYHSLQKYKN